MEEMFVSSEISENSNTFFVISAAARDNVRNVPSSLSQVDDDHEREDRVRVTLRASRAAGAAKHWTQIGGTFMAVPYFSMGHRGVAVTSQDPIMLGDSADGLRHTLFSVPVLQYSMIIN